MWEITLQSCREILWNYKSRSQATIFELKMELEDVGGDDQKRPFRRDLWRAPAQETAIIQILLGKGEGAFDLNRAIDAQQFAFRSIDLCLHCLPLGGEALGNVDNLVALLQRSFAAAGANALLLQRTSLAVVADID